MKIFKSIKWQLQIYYGFILIAVLVTLGLTAYRLQSQQLFGRIDNELQHRLGAIADALHPHPPDPGQRPFDRPPPDQMPDDFAPPDNPEPHGFHLPPQAAELFDSTEAHHFYFEVVSRNRELIASTNLPPDITENIDHAQNAPPELSPQQPVRQTFGHYHMMARTMPSGEIIVVGCSIDWELHELKLTAFKLASVGIIVLFFGLAGGWWISSRAIQPIENISATAVKISAGDLSQRINTAETESELGQLAAMLNSTFARLESAFGQQKQFTSDAAHELRTPVSVILTQTQTALGREREAKDYKQTIEACQRAAQRMRKLITALLELARLDAGQEQMKHLRFDFARTVADCAELVRPLAEERGVKISTDLSPLEISGDSERLAQAVTNLLTNAIQYNHDGGEVKVTGKLENGMAVLAVADTGQGIPTEDLPRVFERFYRADKSRSSGNAGLGLAICHAIVAAHGGNIEVASEEGVGTTFTIRLPA